MTNKIKWNNARITKPKNKDVLLVCCGGSLLEAWYELDTKTWYSDNCKYHESAITHWAKINKPKIPVSKHKPFVKGKSAPQLMNGSFESFQSPLDGSVISCPAKLRAHNTKHGVTNIKDYEAGHFEKRGKEMKAEATGQTAEAKKERCELIDRTLNRYGV